MFTINQIKRTNVIIITFEHYITKRHLLSYQKNSCTHECQTRWFIAQHFTSLCSAQELKAKPTKELQSRHEARKHAECCTAVKSLKTKKKFFEKCATECFGYLPIQNQYLYFQQRLLFCQRCSSIDCCVDLNFQCWPRQMWYSKMECLCCQWCYFY